MIRYWRSIIGFILFAGFPAWALWWISSPNPFIFIYVVMGYAVLTVYLIASGDLL